MSFFAKPGEYAPCGMFSLTHFIVLFICLILISIGIYFSRNLQSNIINIITRIVAILLLILESGKMVFSFLFEHHSLVEVLPLHFCSMFIYATILAGFARGFLQKMGQSFIAGGSIVAGFSFLIMPTTSITLFPMFHFLSCYSMLFHSLMVYLGITYLINKVVVIDKKSFLYYSIFCSFFAIIAYILNAIYSTNLMFLRDPWNIPIKFLKVIAENILPLYSLIIYVVSTYGTYLIVYVIYKIIKKARSKQNG